MLLYVHCYLNDRSTRIVVNGTVSEWIANLIGVPQGSIIAPLLFIFFISEITNMLTKRISYADDLTNWIIHIDLETAAAEIKDEFIQLSKWTNKWRLIINAEKTEYIVFSKGHHEVTNVTLLVFGNRAPMEILATPFAHLSARSPRCGLEIHDIGI